MSPIRGVWLFYARSFDVFGRSRRFEMLWANVFFWAVCGIFVYFLFRYGLDGNGDDIENLTPVGETLSYGFIAFALISFIPMITLQIRRFHDMGHSGWLVALFACLNIIPPIGALGGIVQFFWTQFGSGTAGANKYGQDPRFTPGYEFQ